MAEQIIYRLATDLDIIEINNFYNRVYKKNRTTEQFNWEFNSAPAGRAIYIIAEEFGEVVGTQCAIPYYIITKDNKEIITAKSEDTLVSPNHRGKQIFENMYKLLISECKKNNIAFIWGFTYADKPFRKIGFEVPFKSRMGMLTLSPIKAAKYFLSITNEKNRISYFKILLLCSYSFCKFLTLKLKRNRNISLMTDYVELNNSDVNYLKFDGAFGLKLDNLFLDYRINRNAYSANYRSISWKENGQLKATLQYSISKENVGFILHVYFAEKLSKENCLLFIRTAIDKTDMVNCKIIRFWGFTHNVQNEKEVELLKSCKFVFLKRGISFVGLNLNINNSVDFSSFVLSRMASQGTD